jgi:imidazolonepropionase-like amidohydrolase
VDAPAHPASFGLVARSIFDGSPAQGRPGWIEVEAGAFGARGAGPEPAGRRPWLDANDLTLMPGLIDAHAHPGLPTPLEGANDVSLSEIAGLLFSHCGQMLDAGFTTVRYTGGVDGGLVRALRRGLVRGPRALTAGPVLCQCGGHGDYAPTFSDGRPPSSMWNPGLVVFAAVCDGEDSVRRAVRNAFRQGAGFIKMCVTGGVVSHSDSLDDTQFTVDEIRVAVEEARARGTYVTVHAHSDAGIRGAIEAGAMGVEHGSGLTEATAAVMAERGVRLVPTLTVVDKLSRGLETGVGSVDPESVQRVRRGMEEAIRIARAAGVVVGAGSDLIGPEQSERGLEVSLRAAVTDPTEALAAMTRTNAEVIGRPDLGGLDAGCPADVIGVRGDPLTSPELLADPANIALVVHRGRVVKDPDGRMTAATA